MVSFRVPENYYSGVSDCPVQGKDLEAGGGDLILDARLRLTHLTLSSFPEGTSSPKERRHCYTDATKCQLDAHYPILVGSKFGQRRLRPFPVILCYTSPELYPLPWPAILGVGGSLPRL